MSTQQAPAHLCTTFRLLRTYGACTSGYQKLGDYIRAQFGTVPKDYGLDRPIPIAWILESNGQADALWSLRATQEPSHFARLLACDFAEHVLHLFEVKRPDDKRPRIAIETARKFARGECDRDELIKARDDAAAAAYAADAAADADAYANAYANAARASEKQWQLERFKEALAAEADRCASTVVEGSAASTGAAL